MGSACATPGQSPTIMSAPTSRRSEYASTLLLHPVGGLGESSRCPQLGDDRLRVRRAVKGRSRRVRRLCGARCRSSLYRHHLAYAQTDGAVVTSDDFLRIVGIDDWLGKRASTMTGRSSSIWSGAG